MISGTAEPGARIVLNGNSALTATVASNGTWALTVPDAAVTFGIGPYTLSAVATDAAGNAGTPTTRAIQIETQGPNYEISVPLAVATQQFSVGANKAGTAGVYLGTTLLGNAAAFIAGGSGVVQVQPQASLTVADLRVTDAAGNVGTLSHSGVNSSTSVVKVFLGTNNQADFMPPETITGTSGDDLLFGFGGPDVFNGFAGVDSIIGGDGNDTLLLTATSLDLNRASDQQLNSLELIDASGATAAIHVDLSRQTESFTVRAGAGGNNDTLVGGAGGDRLAGGRGADVLTGNAGNDLFEYAFGSGITPQNVGGDTITDFEGAGAAGGDLILLSQALFGLSTASGQIAAADFQAVSGNITAATQRIVFDQVTGTLYYNATSAAGDEVALVAIRSNGLPVSGLNANDIFIIA